MIYNQQRIIELQHADGSFGCFHSLGHPTKKQPITTEQALRRLRALGLTKHSEVVSKALKCIENCLDGKIQLPDRREKVINWDFFEELMLSTWLKIFDVTNKRVVATAQFWSEIISMSFTSGDFNADIYAQEYRKRIPQLNKGERLIGVAQFYMTNLLKGTLDAKTEIAYLKHLINNPNGIYYVYNEKIADIPAIFASRQTSFYLSALEQIADYSCAKEFLQFAVKWLLINQDKNGKWDLGMDAKDGVNFPISENWKKAEHRKVDCTLRISNLLAKLT